MRAHVLAAAICALPTALAGCAGSDPARPALLNEQHGTFEGVGIGSSSADIRARFGEPAGTQGFIPLEPEGVKGPFAFGVPLRALPPAVMRYDRVAFILSGDRVFGFVTSERGAVLTRKVGVGDSLESFKRAYPLACREAVAGEGSSGETPTYTLCYAELQSGAQLVVTKDPVESITLLKNH
ncbi:MAG: hypothetical protein ACJ74X_05800 [Gaiellaceae bacterium]